MADQTTQLKELADLEATLERQLEELKQKDPFSFYTPSDGSISSEAKEFLKAYLREEDVPAKTEGQLDAHLCTAQTILGSGGNQAGKTTWLAIEALIHATGEIPEALKDVYPIDKLPEEKYRILRLEGESEAQVDAVLIPAIRYWVPKGYLIGGAWDQSYSAKSRQLILRKDGLDVAKFYFNNFTQDVSKLQGVKLTFAGYDEEPPRSHREENLMRMTTAKRLCERFAMTPTKGASYILEDIVKKQGPHTRAFKFASVTNKRANLDVLRQIMDKIVGYEAKKMRLLG
jgi:phage terminase large subunit-like protein